MGCFDAHLLLDLLAAGISVLYLPITKDQHTLPKISDLWIIFVDAFDDDCARHAVKRLTITLFVRMSMVPVQPGRRIGRYLDSITKHLTGIRKHRQHVILRALRRYVHAMK